MAVDCWDQCLCFMMVVLCSVVFYAYLVGLELAFSSVFFDLCSALLLPTCALLCPHSCLSCCESHSPSHMSVFHPFSSLFFSSICFCSILSSSFSSFSNFSPSDVLLVFNFPIYPSARRIVISPASAEMTEIQK